MLAYSSSLASMGTVVLLSPGTMISWLFMELSTVAFCTLGVVSHPQTKKMVEKLMIFFMIQVFMGIFSLGWIFYVEGGESHLETILISLILSLKVGMFPFHNWYMLIIPELNYTMLMMATTLQKFPSLLFILNSGTEMVSICYLNAICMSIMLFASPMSLKNFLTVSSLEGNSWAILAVTHMQSSCIIFFFIYFSCFALLVSAASNLFLNQVSANLGVVIFLNSGLPPFAIFANKLNLLMASTWETLPLSIMLTSGTLTCAAYLNYTCRLIFSYKFILPGVLITPEQHRYMYFFLTLLLSFYAWCSFESC